MGAFGNPRVPRRFGEGLESSPQHWKSKKCPLKNKEAAQEPSSGSRKSRPPAQRAGGRSLGWQEPGFTPGGGRYEVSEEGHGAVSGVCGGQRWSSIVGHSGSPTLPSPQTTGDGWSAGTADHWAPTLSTREWEGRPNTVPATWGKQKTSSPKMRVSQAGGCVPHKISGSRKSPGPKGPGDFCFPQSFGEAVGHAASKVYGGRVIAYLCHTITRLWGAQHRSRKKVRKPLNHCSPKVIGGRRCSPQVDGEHKSCPKSGVSQAGGCVPRKPVRY